MVKDYTTKKTKIKAQVKSRFYYLFWGIATISVVSGQIFVGRGYQQMNESINVLNDILIPVILQLLVLDLSFNCPLVICLV